MELRALPVERLLPMLAGELNSFFFANVGYHPATVAMCGKLDFKYDNEVFFHCYCRAHRGKAFVIARIEFSQTRQGHGSCLMKFLCDVLPSYQYDTIEIERPNANSYAFGAALGLVKKANGDLTGSIKDIDEALSAKGVKYKLVPQR